MFHKLLLKINENIINPFIFLMMSIAIAVFLFGLVQYIVNFDSESDRLEGRKHMFWGIVGLFIMLSVGGIIDFIANTIGVSKPFPLGGP